MADKARLESLFEVGSEGGVMLVNWVPFLLCTLLPFLQSRFSCGMGFTNGWQK